MGSDSYKMRDKCADCGCEIGIVRTVGFQDTVRCHQCGKFQYNAPRAETGKPQRHVKQREDIKPSLRALIMVRAGCACELCHQVAPLHVGHLLSLDAGRAEGLTDEQLNSDENLAAMCESCNLGLGSQPVPLRLVLAIINTRTRITRDRIKAGAA